MSAWGLLTGAAIGLSLAAPPGPMNAIIARESAAKGWAAGWRSGVAAPVADTVFLVALLLGLPRVVDVDAWVGWAAAGGALLMAYFAWGTVRAVGDSARGPSGFWTVFALSMTNPFQVAWWATGGIALLAGQGWWGIAGFEMAIFGWVVGWSGAMAHGAQRWDWFRPLVQVASADLLLAFALLLAGRAAAGL